MGSIQPHGTFTSINTDTDGHKYSATFEPDYFAEGACRYAFKGTLSGDGPRDQDACVTKVFKREHAKNFVQWAPDIAASKKAFKFADEFARSYMPRIRNYIGNQKLEFVIPLVAKMRELKQFKFLGLIPVDFDDRYVKLYEYVAIEPYIPGHYTKFNSNGGYEKGVHKLMTAFCHWTWHKSGHKYMVCDLQGVKTSRKYILTDPAIHSYDQSFGPTDLGVPGMERVLANHRCNSLCRELGLDNPMRGQYIRAGPRSTTYTFQVTEEERMRANRGRSDYFRIMSAIYE